MHHRDRSGFTLRGHTHTRHTSFQYKWIVLFLFVGLMASTSHLIINRSQDFTVTVVWTSARTSVTCLKPLEVSLLSLFQFETNPVWLIFFFKFMSCRSEWVSEWVWEKVACWASKCILIYFFKLKGESVQSYTMSNSETGTFLVRIMKHKTAQLIKKRSSSSQSKQTQILQFP